MESEQGVNTFREVLKITRNEKIVIAAWGVYLLIAALGQIAYLLGYNVPTGYLIYESETGYTGGLFIIVMFFWPMFGIYKIARFEERMIMQRKNVQKTH
ncbi:hypothetical protein FXE84_02175 [Vibrio cholerae]|uniref:hypothetical protein n=1 Tax=Vibrio cholerae TaxID=666 RepID=UPI0004E41BC9|nr:hypothetical protein [Vibrio cholerae]KFE28967.1 hypothetical protein DN30_514 [Vibrio cholerae]TXY44175.1 hypothetical protein FXE84_02175 [Vibrio cholerae]HAS5696824.1 hypothetical protein [Vibrio cholerae]HAS5779605.1 hypothetical protein [Vibrio cholerae]